MTSKYRSMLLVLVGVAMGLVVAGVIFLVVPLSSPITVPEGVLPAGKNISDIESPDQVEPQQHVVARPSPEGELSLFFPAESVMPLAIVPAENLTALTVIPPLQQDSNQVTNEEKQKSVEIIEEEMKQVHSVADQTKADQTKQEFILTELAALRQEESLLKKSFFEKDEISEEFLGQLLLRANQLSEINTDHLQDERRSLVDDLHLFQTTSVEQLPLRRALRNLDVTLGDTFTLTNTMNGITLQFPSTDYARDFSVVINTLTLLEPIDQWNIFMEKQGKAIDVFSVSPSTRRAAVEFCLQQGQTSSFLREWPLLERRVNSWKNSIEQNNPPEQVQEKIVALLRYAGSKQFWLYEPIPQQWYYLTAPPVVGTNLYLVNLFGIEKEITISSKEIANVRKDWGATFFQQLTQEAEQIPDSLKYDDIGLWYARWSELTQKILHHRGLDPLVRFLYLKDICAVLSKADPHFQTRLAPWVRVLATEALASQVNWYEAENERITHLRATASQLLAFIENDQLTVDKTTAELNAAIQKTAYFYQRIGWLDRDMTGNWCCRSSYLETSNHSISGELFVLLPPTTANDEPRWLVMGTLKDNQAEVKLVGNRLYRGTIVFCRTEK